MELAFCIPGRLNNLKIVESRGLERPGNGFQMTGRGRQDLNRTGILFHFVIQEYQPENISFNIKNLLYHCSLKACVVNCNGPG
jgi:hypothetical protein